MHTNFARRLSLFKSLFKELLVIKNNLFSLMRMAVVVMAAQLVACGSGGGSESALGAGSTVGSAALPAAPPAANTSPATPPSSSAAGMMCTGAGEVQAMSADPDVGAVDVSEYCLGVINGYRAQKGLAPYYLQSTTTEAVCCQASEAKTAAETGGHANGGCGWKAQGFCGGGRNPNGTAKASVDWCPKLFFQEGPAVPPSANHYTAMMETAPRGVMCSFYAVSRDKHSIVVNYY